MSHRVAVRRLWLFLWMLAAYMSTWSSRELLCELFPAFNCFFF
jgi:hypothetical protein